ncbi:hypothetical protein AAGG74_18760 [Bacillus mexicanus]|uniref:hypothetical protein n=1 Tax=Bacillus mexicanus TaxID=2834415 RepID=UPI003D243FEB
MNIEALFQSAFKFYPETHESLISHLLKFCNQIEFSDEKNTLPLIILKKKDIYLWIKDENVSDFPFLFSDPEEILFILYQYLSSGNTVYLSNEIPIEITVKEIKKNIDLALLNNEKDKFHYWAGLLKNKQ